MFHQTPLKTIAIGLLLASGLVYALTAGYFGRELIIEASILAILAISLDMVAGFGGMISLCHGAILGIGAYMFAVLTVKLGISPALAIPAAIAAAAFFGYVIGAITARTHGIFFIMATLAFGQMAYVFVFDNAYLVGDDGMPGVSRLDLSALGIDLNDSMQFALLSLCCVALAYAAAAAVLRSGFGRTLIGIRVNENRMRALGLSVWQYKAVAFAISGALAGLAGTLAAQHTMFVSPEMMIWTVSGEALVVVILGGLGTLAGPAIGAALLVFLKHEVSSITSYWHMAIGIVLILTVLAGGRGIYGQLEHMIASRRNRGVRVEDAVGAKPTGELNKVQSHA